MGRTKLLYKDDDKDVPKNYRPITVLEVLYRLICDITQNRMVHLYPKMFHPTQAGFLKKRSATQNVLYVRFIVEKAIQQKRTLYIMFIDLRKAFYRVDREVVYEVMKAKGLPQEWVQWIKTLAENIVTHIAVGKDFTEDVNFWAGVPRGGPLSPMMFNMIIELLISELIEASSKFQHSTLPVPCVWYADDGTLTADKKKYLVVLIKVLQKWTLYTNQIIADDKTKIMVINPHPEDVSDKFIEVNEHKFDIISNDKHIRLLGVGIDAHNYVETPFAYALAKWEKKVVKWSSIHISMQCKAHMISVELIPTLHHVFAVASLPKILFKKFRTDIYCVLGGSIDKNGHPHWTGVAMEYLEMTWKNGGTNLTNLERRAESLLAKIWMEICTLIEQNWVNLPLWAVIIRRAVEHFLQQLNIPTRQIRYIQWTASSSHLSIWQQALKDYSKMNPKVMPITSLEDFEALPLNYNRHFLTGKTRISPFSYLHLSSAAHLLPNYWKLGDILQSSPPINQNSLRVYQMD